VRKRSEWATAGVAGVEPADPRAAPEAGEQADGVERGVEELGRRVAEDADVVLHARVALAEICGGLGEQIPLEGHPEHALAILERVVADELVQDEILAAARGDTDVPAATRPLGGQVGDQGAN